MAKWSRYRAGRVAYVLRQSARAPGERFGEAVRSKQKARQRKECGPCEGGASFLGEPRFRRCGTRTRAVAALPFTTLRLEQTHVRPRVRARREEHAAGAQSTKGKRTGFKKKFCENI